MNISFSKRFENIMKITKRLCAQNKSLAEAKAEAANIEQQFLGVASTAEEYERLCNDYIDVHKAISLPQIADDPGDVATPDEILNTLGPRFGKYEWATFYAEGQTSTIYKARSTDAKAEEKIVALKVMSPDQMQRPHNARREVRTLQRAEANNIVPLLDSFQQAGGQLILVFPFLRHDLENLLRTDTLTQSQSQMVFDGLFGALTHIHAQGIVHRDVKPSNILLRSKDGPVYLIDFGIVWAEGDPDSEERTRKITDVGTTCYRPPEILFGHQAYDSSLDMWAAGCVVAEIVRQGHRQLFDPGPMGSELGLIKSMFSTLGTPTDETWPSAKGYPDWGKMRFKDFPAKSWVRLLPGASKSAIDFVQRTVRFETTQRLTAFEALDHPFAKESR